MSSFKSGVVGGGGGVVVRKSSELTSSRKDILIPSRKDIKTRVSEYFKDYYNQRQAAKKEHSREIFKYNVAAVGIGFIASNLASYTAATNDTQAVVSVILSVIFILFAMIGVVSLFTLVR